MKIVILAAGIGSRLGNPFPKPLTTLSNGKSIMQMQIDNLTAHFDVNDIYVVIGFKKDMIMESFPQLTYIYNPFFDQTNTSKSLLSALHKFKGESVLWLNGDVIFESDMLKRLKPIIDKDQSFIAVNTEKVGEEEVKYTLHNDHVNQLSKQVENALGEAVGVNYISAADLEAFKLRLEQCDANDYFERGLELAIESDGLRLEAVDISDFDCMEIDFRDDLDKANDLIS